MIRKNIKAYCCEDVTLIENYDSAINDETQIWECHHKLEISDDGIFSPKELKEKGLYYGRPASELIFLTRQQHDKLHGENRKQEVIENSKKVSKSLWENSDYQNRISESLSKAHKQGKYDNVFTPEVRAKQSESAKKAWEKYGDKFREIRNSEEYRNKLSKGNKGKIRTDECKKQTSETMKKLHQNPEYRKGFEERCKKMSEINKGQKQYTINGKHRWIKRNDVVPENAIEGWV